MPKRARSSLGRTGSQGRRACGRKAESVIAFSPSAAEILQPARPRPHGLDHAVKAGEPPREHLRVLVGPRERRASARARRASPPSSRPPPRYGNTPPWRGSPTGAERWHPCRRPGHLGTGLYAGRRSPTRRIGRAGRPPRGRGLLGSEAVLTVRGISAGGVPEDERRRRPRAQLAAGDARVAEHEERDAQRERHDPGRRGASQATRRAERRNSAAAATLIRNTSCIAATTRSAAPPSRNELPRRALKENRSRPAGPTAVAGSAHQAPSRARRGRSAGLGAAGGREPSYRPAKAAAVRVRTRSDGQKLRGSRRRRRGRGSGAATRPA